MKLTPLTIAACLSLTFGAGAAEDIVISEFMASNTRTLADENGSFEDWIEISNSGFTTVNLGGWYLTDSEANLTRWQFPATNLNAGGFLVVFASNKDRRVAGGRLHTNFRLSAGGEYLALVKPDGITIATEFKQVDSGFPPQAPDVSYGFGVLATNETLVATNAALRLVVPQSDADGTNWTAIDFDDSAWTSGTNGVGFGSTNVVQADYGAAVAPTAPVGYWRLNESSGTTAVNSGSGAGLNGTYNSATLGTAGPRPPAFNGFEANNTAPTFNGSSGYVNVNNSLLSGRSAFTVGGWIKPAATPVARTGLFGQNDCVEFGFITATTLECWTPGGGSVTGVSYPFAINTWHHVLAVADGTNIRIFLDGALAGTGGSGPNYGSSTFPFNIGGGGVQDATGNFFNGQIDEVVVYHRALSTTEIRSLYQAGTNASGVSVLPYIQTDIGAAMSNVNATAYLRLPFVVANTTNITLLTLRARYDDGFVAYINGSEVARANAPLTPSFNSHATNAHSTLAIEEFRFGPTALVTGTNILAIQGLNVAASDPDFLVLAELVATHTASASGTPVYFTVPSPGAANSGGVAVPGPAILDPAHSPNVPLDADDLVVTARVLPTFNPVAGVTLRYRTMFDPEVPVTMFDDGLHGDGAAGDGVFGVTIPASAGTNGQMIRWYFSATDTAGRTSRWPLFTDPANTPEYLGTIVDPTNVTSKLPIFHLFAAPGVLQSAPPTTQSGADSENGGRVAVFYDGEFYDNVYMELRGNTSAGQQKKSHRMEFNREHPFRHLPEFPRVRKTSLMAEFLDPAYLRQHLCFWLLDQMGVPSPYFYPVRAQLNGSFYALVYHNDAIDEEQVARMGYNPAGALYKAAGNCLPSESSTGVFQKKTEPLNDHSDYQALVRAINETNVPPGQATNVTLRRIAAFDMLDIPEVINYLAGARWCAENDDVWANMSLYRDTTNGSGDGLWRIIPFDMNASWGQRYGGITPLDAILDSCKSHPLYGGATIIACDGSTYNRVYDVVIAVPELRQMMLRRERTVLDRWVFEQGVAPDSRLLETHIRFMTNQIWTEAFLDRAKWGYSTWTASNKPLTNAVNELFNEFINLRRIHWSATHNITNVAKPIGITPTSNAGIPVTQFPDAVVLIAGVEFNPASGNQDQEYICITNPLPYAVDLSGWQLGGGVQHTFHPGTVMPSNSVMYLSPNIVAFRTRALSPHGGQGLFVQGNYSGHLSAWGETLSLTDDTGRLVSTAGYTPAPSLAQQFLRVTEIMYNPSPLAGNTNDAQQFEYVELKNVGPSDLDLRGVRFTNGIEFAFSGSAVTNLPPGAKVLVVRNPAAFTARYGGGPSIAGTFAGTLDNNGESLRLEDATGERILEFAYNNSWYPITDGYGFSLVIVNENAYWDTWGEKASWRPSGVVNGSPAQDDPAPPVIAGIRINELLSHSVSPGVDVIELYNPTAGDVDIGGWFITDDPTNAFKFRIPNGTLIGAGGFKTFSEADFNPTPGTPPSFAFSSKGDEAFLFSGDANTNLTGYIYGFTFDAGETNVSFGRHVSSDGREQFVAQSVNTLGTNNAAPKVGPLVFSEIMYHPVDLPGGGDDSDDEFIELKNITGAAVSLFDPGAPTNTWRLRGGVDFDFPANTNLAANGYLLLVNFDPTNATKLAAFRAKYNVSSGIPILGPYGGKLNNSSDTVKLFRPDAPLDGEVPFILVEAVDYKDSSPWTSAADGTGASLHRVDLSAFGNDPINWIAAITTPGAGAGVGAAPSITAQPASQNGALALGASFSVTATGDAPIFYQWRFDGSALEGETNSALTLSNLKLSQGGAYSVVVFNAAGSAVSSNATLTVLFPPSFYLQPGSRAVHPGTDVTFTAGGTGTLPLRYQWRLNTVDLPGATNASFGLLNVQPSNAGSYTVVLTNPSGSLTSSVASLIVYTNPVVTVDLTNITARAGSNVTFVIQATTSTPITYQWAYNGTNIAGATNSTLLLTNVQPAREGAYSAMLANAYGSSLTATSILSVLLTPVITVHPQNVTVLQGATVTFTAAGIGSPLPLSFRWRKNPGGITLTNMILSATNSSFTIVNAQPFTNGTYTVVITNLAGASALSSNAVLTVLADNDGDGIADDWERLYGFSTNSVADASADPDNDGMTNLQEYLAGTNPTNSLSYLKIDSIVLNTAGTNTLLTLSAVSNHTYSIICRDDVAAGTWVRLADIDARTTNRVVTVTNQLPAGVLNRFYRLQTPKLP